MEKEKECKDGDGSEERTGTRVVGGEKERGSKRGHRGRKIEEEKWREKERERERRAY